jgi:hypothetical protein
MPAKRVAGNQDVARETGRRSAVPVVSKRIMGVPSWNFQPARDFGIGRLFGESQENAARFPRLIADALRKPRALRDGEIQLFLALDHRAAALNGAHDAFLAEGCQRAADGVAVDAELQGQRGFRRDHACVIVITLIDRRADPVGDLAPERHARLPLYLPHHSLPRHTLVTSCP